MIAKFTPTENDRTILRKARGHALTVSISQRNPTRVVLLVNDEDHAKVERLLSGGRGPVTVTDQMTGFEHALVRSDCGSGCRCAVAFREVTPPATTGTRRRTCGLGDCRLAAGHGGEHLL